MNTNAIDTIREALEFLAVIAERGAENDATSYIEAIGLADKALAALDGIGEPFAWCLTDVNRKPHAD